jgi:hypothetical protein
MKAHLKKFLPLAIMLSMLTWGCAQQPTAQNAAGQAVAAKQEAADYKGKIIGVSKKAKTISIEVGSGDKAKVIMVKFDDNTKGIEFAKNGEAATIAWEKRGDDQVATVIKPNLAKLPEGVTEIKPDEMKQLLDKKADVVIIDSRPAKPYAQSHLPNAVSMPVDEYAAKAPELLPKEKDKLLVFYCGGYT